MAKIAVPDSVLTKPGPLTPEEWEIIKTHPVAGEALLRNFPELAPACPAVRHHHERYDGNGYPDQLAGTAIPLEARIIAVADAYSAMTSARSYQQARSRADEITELRRCAGSQFDPDIIKALPTNSAQLRHHRNSRLRKESSSRDWRSVASKAAALLHDQAQGY